MQKYFITFQQMIALRGLTDHTVKSYSTYIRSYLDYLENILHKNPEDVSWKELRDYVTYIKKERSLSDRTSTLVFLNCVFLPFLYCLAQNIDF